MLSSETPIAIAGQHGDSAVGIRLRGTSVERWKRWHLAIGQWLNWLIPIRGNQIKFAAASEIRQDYTHCIGGNDCWAIVARDNRKQRRRFAKIGVPVVQQDS